MPEIFDVLEWKNLWDSATREVIEKRISTVPSQTFFGAGEKKALEKVVEALLPGIDENIPIIEILGHELEAGPKKGVRQIELPWRPDMYKQGLTFLEEESLSAFGKSIPDLSDEQVVTLLKNVSLSRTKKGTWKFPPHLFFQEMVSDIATIYYSFPQSWNEIRFAGPAYPHGYYRLGCDEKMKFEPDLQRQAHE